MTTLHVVTFSQAEVLAAFRGARLLEPITRFVPQIIPAIQFRPRPRDLAPKTSLWPFATDCDRWSPGISKAPWREPAYQVQSRNARINGCLESRHRDVGTLADYNPKIYSTDTKIRCGAFIPASMTALVAHGCMHEHLMRQAGMFGEKLIQYFAPYDPDAYKEPEPEASSGPAPLELTGISFKPPKNDRKMKKHHNPNRWSKKWDPSFTDDECPSKADHELGEIVDVRRKTKVPSATKLLAHSELDAIRKLKKIDPPNFPFEIFIRYKPIVEAAKEAGIDEDAIGHRVNRWFRRAIVMSSTPFELAKNPLTEAQLDDVLERGAMYIALPIDGEADWRWYRLYVEVHGSVPTAIEAFRDTVEMTELDQRSGFTTSRSKKRLTQAIRETKKKYAAIFARGQVLTGGQEGEEWVCRVRPVTCYMDLSGFLV